MRFQKQNNEEKRKTKKNPYYFLPFHLLLFVFFHLRTIIAVITVRVFATYLNILDNKFSELYFQLNHTIDGVCHLLMKSINDFH